MEIKIISSEEIEFKEKDVQKAFEQELAKLEEGLEYIDSEVTIGTGRVDTIAFDTINNRPVFIEYKRQGEFGKDALIQLMDYLSWFARDENHMTVLEKLIRRRKPDIEDFEPYLRLICVVTDIEDRIRNAIYAIANHVKVFSYIVARDTGGNAILVPKLEVDNSEIEPPIPEPASEADILKRHSNLQELFNSLTPYLENDGAFRYTTARSFRFKKDRVFAKLHFRKKYILLELRVGQNRVKDSDFKYWRQGASSWGYTYIHPSKEISEKVKSWIDMARKSGDEIEEGEEEV